uniref:Uncharacterized protein n=1 Tax=Steinernema glaseri TaxID=37863 RepID=A0A1I7ZEH4_9BILA
MLVCPRTSGIIASLIPLKQKRKQPETGGLHSERKQQVAANPEYELVEVSLKGGVDCLSGFVQLTNTSLF